MNQESETSKADINTGGGVYIGGNVNNEGKLIGRDNIENNINTLPLGGQMRSETIIEGGIFISDTVTKILAGSVQIFGETRYYDGESEDEYCVSFVAYVTEEDRARSVVEK